ncbi:MAG: hypothetical protein ACWGMZ_11775, partial [Thermoguttaceae bacterium]
PALWRMIFDRLTEFRYQQLPAAILLDDADHADQKTLDQINRLLRHDCTGQSRLTVVLACRRETMHNLGAPLLELADLLIDLTPWDSADTANYLQTSLAAAGRNTPVFSDSAIARLYELTDGIPRRVSQLADLSMLAGAGEESPLIDAALVDSAYHELRATEG